MALEEKPTTKLDSAWKWWLRGLASVIMVFLLMTDLNVPSGLYFLLIAMFFGPEVAAGQIRLNQKANKDE